MSHVRALQHGQHFVGGAEGNSLTDIFGLLWRRGRIVYEA